VFGRLAGIAGMSNQDGLSRASRRLVAILAADIAGYSALMGANEARTVQDLSKATRPQFSQ
jgi:class 3 adenylate cyclase